MPLSNQPHAYDSVRAMDLSDFDLRFERYRIIQPKAEMLMARSLAKYNQLAPVVYCQLEGSLLLIDGFKRLRAARTLSCAVPIGATDHPQQCQGAADIRHQQRRPGRRLWSIP